MNVTKIEKKKTNGRKKSIKREKLLGFETLSIQLKLKSLNNKTE